MKKFIVAVFICFTIIMTNALAFTDVTESHWAYEKIKSMADSGVIKGFEDGTFKPDEPATREQAATVLRNFFGFVLKEDAKVFSDVSEDAWSKSAINLAGQYLYDENSNLFRPTDKTLRIEVAEALLRYLGFEDDNPNFALLDSFEDKDSFSEKEKKTIALIVENAIMSGDGKNFRPDANITRAEMCTLLCNAFNGKDVLLTKNDNKIVLSVNGEDVTVGEFKLYLGLQRKLYQLVLERNDLWYENVDGVNLYSFCKNSTKEEIISKKINLQKAEELGIKLDDEALAALQAESDSEDAQAICQYYNITPEDLYKINSELSIVNALASNIYNTIDHSQHTHADINELVDETTYSARHILILTQNKTDEEKLEAKKLAEELLQRLKNGEDFGTLANQYSTDAGSNTNGGLYENVKLGQFVKEFENAALTNEIGEIYPEPVESSYGYHIIKTEDKKVEKAKMSKEKQDEIINQDFKEESAKWLSESNVTVFDEIYKTI